MIIGIDVGGTHIDGVIIKNKSILKTVKEPVDFQFLQASILKVLNQLITNIDPKAITKINLSTTISTNAIVENKVNKVGLILQTGPGVNLSNHSNPYNYFIKGYTDHRGQIVKDYNNEEINDAIAYFKKNNINNIAVATKFSTRNPVTEQKIKKQLKNKFNHISLSHRLSGKLNFPRRITTTLLNASVYEIFKRFADNINASLLSKNINAPVNILKADGGIISLKKATSEPASTILSGPAASLMGFLALNQINEDAILIDIGGTTTDIFIFADGVSLFEPLGATIKNNKTLIRAIFSKSVGLGGDSEVNVVDNKLKIGPIRQGKPFSLGGPKPTLTDAFIYLKKLNVGAFNKASEAMEILGEKLNLSKTLTANKIIDIFTINLKNEINKTITEVNSKPVYTIKELLENKQIKPKSINIIGGPAKLLANSINTHFNLKTYYPNYYNVANAIGAALSKTTAEVNLLIDTSLNKLIVPELGIIKTINKNITSNEAANLSYTFLDQLTNHNNHKDYEIISQSSFNMIDGFYTRGKNIRIKAQVKPGLIYNLEGDLNE